MENESITKCIWNFYTDKIFKNMSPSSQSPIQMKGKD